MTGICINLRTNQLSTDWESPECSEEFTSYKLVRNKTIYCTFTLLTKGDDEVYRAAMKNLYRFVEGQLRVSEITEDIYFANIWMGEGVLGYISMFDYLCSLEQYQRIVHKVYVGEVTGYGNWLKRIYNNQM